MPQLLQDMRVLQSSPIHSITEVVVHLDPDPNEGDVYVQDKHRPQILCIAKPGYLKLLSAAGMEEISDQCVSRMVEDRVFFSKEVIKWTQPDGKDIILSGDKTFDLRIGGSRWEKTREKELDFMLVEWARENNIPRGKRRDGRNESNNEYIPRVLATIKKQGLEEKIAFLESMAKEKASRQIRQQAQFGTELAQTGAIERAVKAQLSLKSTYTKQEIEEGFTILRSEYRWDMLAGWLGAEDAKQLKQAFALRGAGMGAEDIPLLTAVGQALSATQPTQRAVIEQDETMDLFGEPDKVAAVVEALQANPYEELFQKPIEDNTAFRVRNKMIRFHGWRDFNRTEASKRTEWLFQRQFSDIVEAEARLLIWFYNKLQSQKNLGVPTTELTNQAKHLKEQVDQCLIEKRMPREPDAEATQSKLPGIPDAEAPADISDSNEREEGTSSDTAAGNDE